MVDPFPSLCPTSQRHNVQGVESESFRGCVSTGENTNGQKMRETRFREGRVTALRQTDGDGVNATEERGNSAIKEIGGCKGEAERGRRGSWR